MLSGAAGIVPAFGPLEIVRAGGSELAVDAYSTPASADWNDDGLADLIVGEKTAGGEGKVRIYVNSGTREQPAFGAFSYVQSAGSDLVVPAGGCLGVSPRVADLDGDDRKDLLLGLADGTVQFFSNANTDADPQFGAAVLLQAGPNGAKTDVDVGARATVDVADWNNDGRDDLVVGALDGLVRVFLNRTDAAEPDLAAALFVTDGGADLAVPSGRSAPNVVDLDLDGRKDLVLGNTEGQLIYYANRGTDAAPAFDGGTPLAADGHPIDLDGTPRSRGFVGDFNADGAVDLVFGAKDGRVRVALGLWPGARVVGRHVYYNNSAFDGLRASIHRTDDAAVATDKQALLPGISASAANYTNCDDGITGIMVDLKNPARPGELTAADFRLRVGNDDAPAAWPDAPAPAEVAVRPGTAEGTVRVSLTWHAGRIVDEWLEVTVLSTPATGLARNDVFYFGNAPAEMGNGMADALVDVADLDAIRDRMAASPPAATIDDCHDCNRDGAVDAIDLVVARDWNTTSATALRLIAPLPPGLPRVIAEGAPNARPERHALSERPTVKVVPTSPPHAVEKHLALPDARAIAPTYRLQGRTLW